MSGWLTKCWGKTRDIYYDEYVLKQELILKQNTYCSVHYHADRVNRFILKAGEVRILLFLDNDVKSIELNIDEPFVIGPKIIHCFVVISDGVMEEEYYNEHGDKVSRDDIVRLCEGDNFCGQSFDCLVDRLKLGIRDAR